MLALVKTQAGPGLELGDVETPRIGINDVLIRVKKTGICGTDLHIAGWDPWAAGHVAVGPLPFARTGPGKALDGQPKYDLTQINEEYFTRLRTRAGRESAMMVVAR